KGVTSNWLLEKITTKTKQLVKKANLASAINSIGNPLLITMGAGDIGLEVEALTKELINA
ncbi:MAG: UDP-N-acetylmuramate--L-alanine ligase, partial [Bacteroidota bacterium]|nr:UDP-N-acetylmuramate--L-alanine ligase [Bacteroidota bacterium]